MNPAVPQSHVVEITAQNFESEVIQSELPVLIDLWAPWCGPCRQMKPVLEEAAQRLAGRVKVGAANVDEQPEISAAFRVQGIPAFALLRGRDVVAMFTGAMPLEAFLARVENALVAK